MGRAKRPVKIIDGIEYFKCTHCKEFKKRSDYHKHFPVPSWCKVCANAASRKTHTRNREVPRYNFYYEQEGTLQCGFCGEFKPANSHNFLVQRNNGSLKLIDLCLDCSNNYEKNRAYWYDIPITRKYKTKKNRGKYEKRFNGKYE